MSDETCARREKRCSDFVALQAENERLRAAFNEPSRKMDVVQLAPDADCPGLWIGFRTAADRDAAMSWFRTRGWLDEIEQLELEVASWKKASDLKAAEIKRLTAQLNATPTPETILLQARKSGGEWCNIFPAQLSSMAREGFEVRALEGK